MLLASYFGELQENLRLACSLPVNGLHIDAIKGKDEVIKVIDRLPGHKILSLGVINGRNIWKIDLADVLAWLKLLHERLQERLWLVPSCSLLHVPVDLDNEQRLDNEIPSWLSFAIQKLDELDTLAKALNHGTDTVAEKLFENTAAIQSRKQSSRVQNEAVKNRMNETNNSLAERQALHDEISQCVQEQETLGLDVLVQGEPERNDTVVEYFGEQLTGYAFTQSG